MATQTILSKLTNLVIPDEIIFDIDKMVYHAKHAVHHKKVMNEFIYYKCFNKSFKFHGFGSKLFFKGY
jgi:hypothetical protein